MTPSRGPTKITLGVEASFKCTLAGPGRCHSAGPYCFIISVLCFAADGYECGYSVEGAKEVVFCKGTG